MIARLCSVLAFVFLLSASGMAEERSTILVLDESGSMWSQLPEGRSRIEVARDVLSDFLSARDPAEPLGVIAYGHNRRGDCGDIETIAAVGLHSPTQLGQQLRSLMPRGKTPLADALQRAADAIPATAEAADIVLVTDGLETCGGDPCAVAAALAESGIDVRAHIVGFGLSEGEIQQISCVAEQTGGLVISANSGDELADGLRQTAGPIVDEPQMAENAALELTLDTDEAGRPGWADFAARNLATGAEMALGRLDYATAWTLPAELGAGQWEISADAGDLGNGRLVVDLVAGERRVVAVPFTGLLPRMHLDQIGPYRAGASALFPINISREGLAVGGADFLLTLLPADATSLEDRAITWSSQDGSAGSYVGQLNLPQEPADYLVAWHRYGETDLAKALAVASISVVQRPTVSLAAPSVVAPDGAIPIEVRGGGAYGDRVEIWRGGALVSWDQSAYLQELFDNEYGPARILSAPSEPGTYQIVYLFADIDGADAVAATLDLIVGNADMGAAEGVGSEDVSGSSASAAPTQSIEASGSPSEDVGYSCASDHGVPCIFDDADTGLLFALPPGWFSDMPTREAATAGNRGADGPVRMSIFSDAQPEPDSLVLNPHQWIAMNGPCVEVQAGQICWFAPGSDQLAYGLEVLTRALFDRRIAEGTISLSLPDGHGPDQSEDANRAWTDYPHRCLPGDRTVDNCDMRDAATSLFFHLPEGWVAEASTRGGPISADFWGTDGSAGHIALNPADWPDATQAQDCGITRAGNLCTDTSIADASIRGALDTLRFTLTTGDVLRRCGKEACEFAHPNPPISGWLPPLWSVEVGRLRADGRVSTWFWDMDREGNFKLMGLNQMGGDNCFELQRGDSLCEFTPYISTDESSYIATMFVPPAPTSNLREGAQTVSPEAFAQALAIAQGQ